MTFLIWILVFGAVVVVHEFGHYIAAKRAGIYVVEFAVGLGPKLIGFKRGETLWSLRLFPLGGYCLMYGDDTDAMATKAEEQAQEHIEEISKTEESEQKIDMSARSFNSKSVLARMSVMFAGSFMNFILAFILLVIVAGFIGVASTTVMDVSEGAPADGVLLPGDRIISINGFKTRIFEDITFEIATSGGAPLEILIERMGVRQTLTIQPAFIEERWMLGFRTERYGAPFMENDARIQANFGHMLVNSAGRIIHTIRTIPVTISRIFSGMVARDSLVGPIGMFGIVNNLYQGNIQAGAETDSSPGLVRLSIFISMLQLCAVISASLGVINLLPIPALDGSRIMFLLLEAVRGRPISQSKEGMVHVVGFVLLLALGIFIAYNDIVNLLR